MKEEWRDIVGYEGLYQVSNLGKVSSLITNKILKLQTDKHGYLFVGIRKNGKRKFKKIHRLVAEVFINNIKVSNGNIKRGIVKSPFLVISDMNCPQVLQVPLFDYSYQVAKRYP